MRGFILFLTLAGSLLGKTLYFGVRGEPVSLDPAAQWEDVSSMVVSNIFETLVEVKPGSLEIMPKLAVRWERSKDGKKWVFYLRPGVKFSNGQPLTSREVVYSFKRLLKMPPGRFLFPYIKEIKALGKNRVVFLLKREFSPFLHLLTVTQASVIYPSRGELGFLGTGPYYVSLWQKGKRMVLKRNPFYWGRMGNIDKVVMLFSLSMDSIYSLLLRDKLDLTNGISMSRVEALRNSGRFYLLSSPVLSLEYLVFNPEDPWAKKGFVREALSYIWNSRWVRLSFGNYREPACRIIPFSSRRCPFGYQPRKARALLRKNKVFGRVKLSLVYPDDALYAKLLLPFVNEAKKIGINIKLVPVRSGRELDEIYRRRKYSLSLFTWIWDYPEPYNILSFLLSGEKVLTSYPTISSFQGVKLLRNTLEEALSMDTSRQRRAVYERVEGEILRKRWIIPVSYLKVSLFVNRRIKGIKVDPTGLVRLGEIFKE